MTDKYCSKGHKLRLVEMRDENGYYWCDECNQPYVYRFTVWEWEEISVVKNPDKPVDFPPFRWPDEEAEEGE